MKTENLVKRFFSACWDLVKQFYEFCLEAVAKFTWPWLAKLVDSTVKFAVMVALMFVGLLCAKFGWEIIENEVLIYERPYKTTALSENVMEEWFYTRGGKIEISIVDKKSDEVKLEHVDWVITSSRGDSLAVYKKQGKSGYINRYTGEVTIPAQFDKAWLFAEDYAAVEDDGYLQIIDRSGKILAGKEKKLVKTDSEPMFKNGHMIVKSAETQKLGVVNHKGEWALTPDYDCLHRDTSGLYSVERDGKYGLFSAEFDTLQTVDKRQIRILDENAVAVQYEDRSAKLFDFKGNVLVDNWVEYAENLYYDQTDNDYDDKVKAPCKSYSVFNRCGLMSADGRTLTKPIFDRIYALTPDLYMCSPYGVYNSKGQLVSGKIVKQP